MARATGEVVHLMTDPAISKLAREIARDIKPIDEILKEYKLSAEQFDLITESKFFQQRLAEEVQLWNASDPLSIARRIETKSATLVEDCLLEVYRLIHDAQQPMNAKVEALKWAARMAGLGDNSKTSAEGAGVRITINVGGKALEFEKERVLPKGVTDVVDLTPSNS